MISGGGTGGHVYPALAVVAYLVGPGERSTPSVAPSAICWVGSHNGMEKALVERNGIPFMGITASGLRGRGPFQATRGMIALARGFIQARRLVSTFRPDVLFATGGYVCAPVVLAAWLAHIPVLIYLPDVEPGLTIRFLARFARRVAVTTAASVRFFRPGQAVVTGYPVRQALWAHHDPISARKRLGLTSPTLGGEERVLLVMGGSQGARSINRAICDGVEELLAEAQIIHLTGRRDVEWVRERWAALPDALRARYHVHDYLEEEMADALLAADLVVARAGASTLGELPAAGVPSILVPYPYAGAHQWANANFLAGAGAAVIVPDHMVDSQLVATVISLLQDAPRRETMRRAMRGLAQPDAAERIARELKELAA
ncbi:MAG: undecaprenyldiphospho-muramoylpentapeptide beta-N-acetylglucosaminyltransferase [Anaerolineae bacterium]|nr:undecaprenyldiphospho-muramoylpentapeptide beta-N-acetylglucosaminyltransferase [Anaerolineae bacterium]MDW8071627.1 undecaprenyldiphospho-muramoylpentapeptide beta-N-acetylglucosaminyltransferase [Anaerolineae bacterium]